MQIHNKINLELDYISKDNNNEVVGSLIFVMICIIKLTMKCAQLKIQKKTFTK